MIIYILFIFLTSNAHAVKKTGSSSMEPFTACVEASVAGNQSEMCKNQEDKPECIGLRRALEFSAEKSKCLRQRGTDCEEWGHRGRTQSQWVSIASGHLTNFGVCIKKRYGSNKSSGLKEALEDESLLSMLKNIDDGSKVFDLAQGTILLRALQENTFGSVIGNSPYAEDQNPQHLFRIKDAANTPDPAVAKWEPEEGWEQPKTESFLLLAKNSSSTDGEYTGSQVIENPAAKRKKPAESLDVGKATLNTSPAPKKPTSNPYRLGLDKTLFERINIFYLYKSSSMRKMEDYVDLHPVAPAKDLSELLSRGGGI